MTYTYTRKGIIVGVPTRDLTDEEYKRNQRRIKASEKATGRALYVKQEAAQEPILPPSDGEGSN